MLIQNVLKANAQLGECPLWDVQNQLLYWVDIDRHQVHQFNPLTGNDRFFAVGDVVGSIALAQGNRLLIAQRDRLAFLNIQTEEITTILSLEADKPKNRFNDGKCDAQGRFWFGSISQEKGQANLYRYDPDNSLHLMETGLTNSNGLGWSPDETIFYHTDTPEQKIYAYDFESKSGKIRNRRILVDLTHESFQPDGLTIDTEGYLWSAMWDGGCVIRFAPDGQEVTRIQLPAQFPTCCTFGGEQLSYLYITTAAGESSPSQQNGDLFCLPTNSKGFPSHRFQINV